MSIVLPSVMSGWRLCDLPEKHLRSLDSRKVPLHEVLVLRKRQIFSLELEQLLQLDQLLFSTNEKVPRRFIRMVRKALLRQWRQRNERLAHEVLQRSRRVVKQAAHCLYTVEEYLASVKALLQSLLFCHQPTRHIEGILQELKEQELQLFRLQAALSAVQHRKEYHKKDVEEKLKERRKRWNRLGKEVLKGQKTVGALLQEGQEFHGQVEILLALPRQVDEAEEQIEELMERGGEIWESIGASLQLLWDHHKWSAFHQRLPRPSQISKWNRLRIKPIPHHCFSET